MIKVSIGCPVYNSEKFIRQTLNSFIGQTFKDIEIIICNDGSTDGTLKIIEEFNDPRIKVINQQNMGPSIASDVVIANASCSLIALCAADDVMELDRIEKEYEFMQKNPDCDVVYSFVNIIDKNGNKISHSMEDVFNQNKTPIQMLNHFFYNGNFINAVSLMFKKQSMQQFNPCMLQLQDFDMWVRILLDGGKIMCLPEKLTNYRIHENNLSGITSSSQKHIIRDIFEHERVLRHFATKIKTVQDLKTILNIDVTHQDLIPFAIAKEALKKERIAYYNFAVDTIYTQMLNPDICKLVDQYYAFKMKDLYSLIADNKVYNTYLSPSHKVDSEIDIKKIIKYILPTKLIKILKLIIKK